MKSLNVTDRNIILHKYQFLNWIFVFSLKDFPKMSLISKKSSYKITGVNASRWNHLNGLSSFIVCLYKLRDWKITILIPTPSLNIIFRIFRYFGHTTVVV